MNSSPSIAQRGDLSSNSTSLLFEAKQELQTLRASVQTAFLNLEQILKNSGNSHDVQNLETCILNYCAKELTTSDQIAEEIKKLKELANYINHEKFLAEASLQQQSPPPPPSGCKKPLARKVEPPKNPHLAKRARIGLSAQSTPSDLLRALHEKERELTNPSIEKRIRGEEIYYNLLSSTLLAIQVYTKNSYLYADRFSVRILTSLNQRLNLSSYDSAYMTAQKNSLSKKEQEMKHIIDSLNQTFASDLREKEIKFCWPFTHNGESMRMFLLSDNTFSIADSRQRIQPADLSIDEVNQGRSKHNPIVLA